MGLDLYAAVQQVGLSCPSDTHMEILLEGDAMHAMPIDVLRSLHPLAQQHNVSARSYNWKHFRERVHTEARLNTVVNVIPIVRRPTNRGRRGKEQMTDHQDLA
jgi:hypothetical protein